MAGETRFAQVTHEGHSVPRRERLFVPIRCLCGLIQDEDGHSVHSVHWVTRRTYLKTHRVEPSQLPLHSHLLSWVFHSGNGNNEESLHSQRDWRQPSYERERVGNRQAYSSDLSTAESPPRHVGVNVAM